MTVTKIDLRVMEQNIEAGSVVEKDSIIELTFKAVEITYINENSIKINDFNSSSGNDLTININECAFSEEYNYQPNNDNWLVRFERNISGTFEYSRPLTESELADWSHGGKLIDENGQEYDKDISFFSSHDGVFAIELPETMPKGTYTYMIYQYIEGQYCEAEINFTVN